MSVCAPIVNNVNKNSRRTDCNSASKSKLEKWFVCAALLSSVATMGCPIDPEDSSQGSGTDSGTGQGSGLATGNPNTTDPVTSEGPTATTSLTTSDGTSTTGQTTSSGTSDSATTMDASETEDSATSEDSSEGPDTTSASTTGNQTASCEAVDILFVLDNHSGGGGNLATLASSMPGIAEKIQTNLGDSEVNTMVIDTDGVWGYPLCEQQCEQLGFCEEWPEYPCNVPLGECDRTLGSGLVYPNSQSEPCDVLPGKRYISTTQDSFAQSLVCLSDVGNYGDGLQYQAEAITEALRPELSESCNAGFLRNGAPLIIVLVSHAPDKLSEGSPDSWVASVEMAKGGLDQVVMLGILDDSQSPGSICSDPGGDVDMRLHQFVDAFPNHLHGSVCAASYGSYFAQALDKVGEICSLVSE